MDRRPELQIILQNLLGSTNVYYQPPSNLKMQYPAIVYSLDKLRATRANDGVYGLRRSYSILYIDRSPNSAVPDKLARLQHSSFNRTYISDGLHHYAFTIYH